MLPALLIYNVTVLCSVVCGEGGWTAQGVEEQKEEEK